MENVSCIHGFQLPDVLAKPLSQTKNGYGIFSFYHQNIQDLDTNNSIRWHLGEVFMSQ